jgi:hypothetical protein
MPKNKIVYIKWSDASYDNDVLKPENFDEECWIESVGILAKETDTHYTVCVERLMDGLTFRHIHYIPKVLVVKKKILGKI